jgi:uncharacterized MAPEG superfamily protein
MSMTLDLRFLIYSAVLSWVMVLTASAFRVRGWTMGGVLLAFGNRDNLPEATLIAGRAERAARNMLENMVLFIALLVVAHAGGVTDSRVATGAQLFFWARLVYFPVYLAGVRYVRSAVWLVGLIGLYLILAAVV